MTAIACPYGGATMAILHIQVVADLTYAQQGNNAGLPLLMSITDANGVSYTGLTQKEFEIQLLFDWFEGMPTNTYMFYEESTQSFMHEKIPGVYSAVFNNVNNVWSNTTY